MNPQDNQPPIRAVLPLALYPTLGSLQEVVDLATSQVPIKLKNDVLALLYTYHNTLLLQQLKERSSIPKNLPTVI